jgi:uncharacterized membrane protein YeiB
MLFGIAHAILIWTGDVLHMYPLLGMFLVLVRKAPDKVVLGLISMGLLLPTALSIHRVLSYTAADEVRLTHDTISHAAELKSGVIPSFYRLLQFLFKSICGEPKSCM